MKSSNGSVPKGLSLYFFEYPDGLREMPATVECLDGNCDPAPKHCHLAGDEEAIRFAQLYTARRAVHAISGRVVYSNDPM